MSIASFIRRLLLAAEEAVNASVDRALGEEVPLNVLLTEDDVEEHAWGAGVECPGCAAADARDGDYGDDTLALFGNPNAQAWITITGPIEEPPPEVMERIRRLFEPDAMRAREQETAELNALLKLPAFERGQA